MQEVIFHHRLAAGLERPAYSQTIAVLDHARELLPNIDDDRRLDLELQFVEKISSAQYGLGETSQSAATYSGTGCARGA